MRRRDAPSVAMLPSEIPEWVLHEPRSGFDPRQVLDGRWEGHAEFQAWQDRRKAWLAENAPHLRVTALYAERLRRWPVVDRVRLP